MYFCGLACVCFTCLVNDMNLITGLIHSEFYSQWMQHVTCLIMFFVHVYNFVEYILIL